MDVEGEGDFETTLKGVVGSGKVRMTDENKHCFCIPPPKWEKLFCASTEKIRIQIIYLFCPYCIRRLTLSPRARAETRFEFDTHAIIRSSKKKRRFVQQFVSKVLEVRNLDLDFHIADADVKMNNLFNGEFPLVAEKANQV